MLDWGMDLNEVRYPLELFSITHFTILAVLWTTVILLARFIVKRFGFTKKVVWVCFVIGMLCEAEKILFFIYGSYSEMFGYSYRLPATHLPFAMCPFQLFLILALLLSQDVKKRWALLGFMYPMLVGGAGAGTVVAFAANTYHGLLELATWRYFVFHGMLVFLGYYLYWSKPIHYTIKEYGMSLVGAATALVLAIWLNAFFAWDPHVNFLFVVRPPTQGLPFLHMYHGWLVYILRLVSLAIVIFTLCYIKVIIRDVPLLAKLIREKLARGQVRAADGA